MPPRLFCVPPRAAAPPEDAVEPPCPGVLGLEEPQPAPSAATNTNEPSRRDRIFMRIRLRCPERTYCDHKQRPCSGCSLLQKSPGRLADSRHGARYASRRQWRTVCYERFIAALGWSRSCS